MITMLVTGYSRIGILCDRKWDPGPRSTLIPFVDEDKLGVDFLERPASPLPSLSGLKFIQPHIIYQCVNHAIDQTTIVWTRKVRM